MISNLINVKKPITTKPTASDEWASSPSKASPGKLVFLSSFTKINAIIDEVINIATAILKSRVYAIVTPSKAEWARVSPKYDNLLQTTKHPRGPVTKAIPIPATKALIKKSSNI